MDSVYKKIIYDKKSLIDLTQDTIRADAMLQDITAHDASGQIIIGNIIERNEADVSQRENTILISDGYYSTPIEYQPQATIDAATIDLQAFVDGGGTYQIVASTKQAAGFVNKGGDVQSLSLETISETKIIPSKNEQIVAEANRYTAGPITVEAIPDKYQDISGVTATSADVLEGKEFIGSDGILHEGTIQSKIEDDLYITDHLTVGVPAGYYSSEYFKTLFDINLTPENIKKGVTIFGITGTYDAFIGTFYILEPDDNLVAYDFPLGIAWYEFVSQHDTSGKFSAEDYEVQYDTQTLYYQGAIVSDTDLIQNGQTYTF